MTGVTEKIANRPRTNTRLLEKAILNVVPRWEMRGNIEIVDHMKLDLADDSCSMFARIRTEYSRLKSKKGRK